MWESRRLVSNKDIMWMPIYTYMSRYILSGTMNNNLSLCKVYFTIIWTNRIDVLADSLCCLRSVWNKQVEECGFKCLPGGSVPRNWIASHSNSCEIIPNWLLFVFEMAKSHSKHFLFKLLYLRNPARRSITYSQCNLQNLTTFEIISVYSALYINQLSGS